MPLRERRFESNLNQLPCSQLLLYEFSDDEGETEVFLGEINKQFNAAKLEFRTELHALRIGIFLNIGACASSSFEQQKWLLRDCFERGCVSKFCQMLVSCSANEAILYNCALAKMNLLILCRQADDAKIDFS